MNAYGFTDIEWRAMWFVSRCICWQRAKRPIGREFWTRV